MTALAMAGIETFPSSFLQPGTATLILNLAQVVQLLADYCDTLGDQQKCYYSRLSL